MKQLLAFIGIMTLCSSLINKPTVVPACANAVKVRWFKKGKLVSQRVFDDGNYWLSGFNTGEVVDSWSKGGDSVTINLFHVDTKKKK